MGIACIYKDGMQYKIQIKSTITFFLLSADNA